MKEIIVENISCKLGQNAVENWKLFSKSKPNFLFFHLTSFPSGYLIMECDEIPELEIIRIGALACKMNTKYLNLKGIYVDYTPCSNVKKGEKVGEVEYKSNRKVNKIKV